MNGMTHPRYFYQWVETEFTAAHLKVGPEIGSSTSRRYLKNGYARGDAIYVIG